MKKNRKKSFLKNFSLVIYVITIIISLFLIGRIYIADILPFKFIVYALLFFGAVYIIIGLIIKNIKSRVVLGLVDIILFLLSTSLIYGIFKINETINFLKDNLNLNYETYVYNIVVNSDSQYDNIDDIKDKVVYSYKDMDDMSLVEDKLKSIEFKYLDSYNDLLDLVLNDDNNIILVNSGIYDSRIINDESYEENTKVIYSIEVKVEIEDSNNDIDVTKKPFAVYLSGIDTRSSTLPSRSLSDVNIILAVNPINREILMVHIPRDYYVRIPNTTGYKDKLTHAGALGGINLSMETIENLLEIEIPYYVRVNFNAVVNLVDAIDGINIYSDVNYSFTTHTNKNCKFDPGYNYVYGDCALAFARERYAYETGDRHRGENQEQVIELVIKKISSSKTIVSNYSDILSALNGTFETNINYDNISDLVKMQLNDMSSWHIESYNLNGTGALLPTYSYPNQNLYVMEPDMNTVYKAIEKLNNILDTN